MSGRMALTAAYPRPSRSIAATRMLCTSTSAPATSCSTALRPASVLRSTATERLLRLMARKMELMPRCSDTPLERIKSPSRLSILTTSAP